MSAERGFALVAVLWVTVALTVLGGSGVLAARTAGVVTRNRVALARARWAAEGCLAVALARLDSLVRSGRTLEPIAADTLHFASGASCLARSLDPGSRLNPDHATPEMIGRLADAAGSESEFAMESLLTRDGDGRINLNAAPGPVLAALPGFTEEVVGVVLERRAWRERLTDLFQIISRLSPLGRQAVLDQYGELLRRVSFAPSSLVVTANAWSGSLRPVATIELVLVPAGDRVAVLRRRMW
jgi:hypothetical protein